MLGLQKRFLQIGITLQIPPKALEILNKVTLRVRPWVPAPDPRFFSDKKGLIRSVKGIGDDNLNTVQKLSSKDKWGSWDSNPGLLSEKCECFLCALPPPYNSFYPSKFFFQENEFLIRASSRFYTIRILVFIKILFNLRISSKLD